MNAETIYSETEALIRAMEDYDADSGNNETTVGYLVENFLPGELRRLAGASALLHDACREARQIVERRRV